MWRRLYSCPNKAGGLNENVPRCGRETPVGPPKAALGLWRAMPAQRLRRAFLTVCLRPASAISRCQRPGFVIQCFYTIFREEALP